MGVKQSMNKGGQKILNKGGYPEGGISKKGGLMPICALCHYIFV